MTATGSLLILNFLVSLSSEASIGPKCAWRMKDLLIVLPCFAYLLALEFYWLVVCAKSHLCGSFTPLGQFVCRRTLEVNWLSIEPCDRLHMLKLLCIMLKQTSQMKGASTTAQVRHATCCLTVNMGSCICLKPTLWSGNALGNWPIANTVSKCFKLQSC